MNPNTISKKCLNIINSSDQPFHTEEIARQIHAATGHRVRYALQGLMSNGEVRGKFLDVGKGIWIWWRKDAFGDDTDTPRAR